MPRRDARRDALAEQQLVRDLWQQVEARLDSSAALRAFLTQKIDDCGQTVAFEAFDLVRRVLNPDGFVRRAHKSADQNLGAAITMPESPWTAEGSLVDRQWDFNNAWMSQKKEWSMFDDEDPLKTELLEKFCRPDDTMNLQKREEQAKYLPNDSEHDKTYSMPKLDLFQKYIPILKSLPDDTTPNPIRRWETFRSRLPSVAFEDVIRNNKSWSQKKKRVTAFDKMDKPELEALLRAKGIHPNSNMSAKTMRELLKAFNKSKPGHSTDGSDNPIDEDGSGDSTEYKSVSDVIEPKRHLESYWKVVLRSSEWVNGKKFKHYEYDKKHSICALIDRPDLILEVAYFSADSGLFQKRVIFCEVDGDDKTSVVKEQTKKTPEDVNEGDQEPAEEKAQKTKPKDPLKLAYKLMTSSNAQQSLQSETYHIRSNWTKYNDHAISRSLLETTGIELPEFADLIATYSKQKRTQDFDTLHHAIHLVHHMFRAHVKIAFLIHMQVVHGIDLRSLDSKEKRMQNHCFFVNFEASHVPDKLVFEDIMPEMTKTWLESHLMLHTRIGITTYDRTASKNQWNIAPVMYAGSPRAAMRDWEARVASAQLPRFPYEKQSVVSVSCATIQRVDMHALIEHVQQASREALQNYYAAATMQIRPTTIMINGVRKKAPDIRRRQFADRCFLTRSQQYDREKMWNQYATKLRQRTSDEKFDLLEFNWGYEDPVRKRSVTNDFDLENANETCWKKWDQVDVRMYYFHLAMKKRGWEEAAHGMWYLQDYIDFFDALRNLAVESAPSDEGHFTCLHVGPDMSDLAYQHVQGAGSLRNYAKDVESYHVSMACLAQYAFQKKSVLDVNGDNLLVHDPDNLKDLEFLQNLWTCYQSEQNDNTGNPARMPVQSERENRAYHIFSILSWFFDCRDGGACRWRWEDYLLKYFGAKGDTRSDFEKFRFERNTNAGRYFNQPWFLMTFFMELNFRNAIAPIHCQLFESSVSTSKIPGDGLQKKAKELYHRQHSLLNTRARCEGLQNVSAGLSWKKNASRNCLRNLLLSSLDDTLPGLDPQLEQYLQQFNAPNAALFLRMIEVSNVLALRELALQHKLASQTSPGASKLEQRLSWFEPAVQSEIRHLMYSVERDDSVFTAAPVVHPTKAIVLEEELMRKWVRQTLGVHQHLHTLRCPLDVKFHMFTSPETYRVFMQLFCTKTQLDNSHTQRPVLFVLLQIHLAAEVLKGAQLWDDDLKDDQYKNKPINSVQRSNPVLQAADTKVSPNIWHYQYRLKIVDGEYVPCTFGSSLETWPLRDQNLWCQPKRNAMKKVEKTPLSISVVAKTWGNLLLKKPLSATEMNLVYNDEYFKMRQDMKDDEVRRWLLLACARPVPCRYELQEDGKYIAGEKKHEFTVQDCVVRQQREWPHASTTGRQRDTMIAAVSSFAVSAEHRLEVSLCDDADTYIFFEKVEPELEEKKEPFPQYIQDIVTDIPNRTLIYVPQVFASLLRRERIHDQVYSHDESLWRMVCVGYRAWAWKRLLVKSIFFDALTKVVTRSSVLLSLFQVPKTADDENEEDRTKRQLNLQQLQNIEYRKMLAETKDTFGALKLKENRFKDNLEPKHVQYILTVFRKHKRTATIELEEVDFHDSESVRVHGADRQVHWCDFYKKTLEEKTSRFMLIDRRLHQSLLPEERPHPLNDEDVLQYRSYLYTTSDNDHSVVSFKGKVYVKFPRNYCVLKIRNDVKTGKMKLKKDYRYFATLFDCRRYSCMKPDYVVRPDSDSTIKILDSHAQVDALSKQVSRVDDWRSTPHDDADACKYVYQNPSTKKVIFPKNFLAFIEHSTSVITENMQKHMYTLPDIFKLDDINDANMPEMAANLKVHESWYNMTFKNELKKAKGDQRNELWNRLRNSSRYIATDIETDQTTKSKTVKKTLDTGSTSFASPFDSIIDTLRRRILPKPNEDS